MPSLKRLFSSKSKDKGALEPTVTTEIDRAASSNAVTKASDTVQVQATPVKSPSPEILPEKIQEYSKHFLYPGYYGLFPRTFQLYYIVGVGKVMKHYLAFVVNHGGTEVPIYAITFDRHSSVHVYLHSQPDIHSPYLGLAGLEKSFRSSALIAIPRADNDGDTNHVERMTTRVTRKMSYFEFGIDIGDKYETFEWQEPSAENEDLKKVHNLVWKSASTPDHQEIVAVWVAASGFRSWDDGVGTFTFVGKSMTGELGHRWALMAVMTMLRIANEQMYVKEWGKVFKEGGKLAGKGAFLGAKIGLKVAELAVNV